MEFMAKFNYNVITQKVYWDCPRCQYINFFAVKKKPIVLVCTKCRSTFQIDPKRYAQFKTMNDVCEEMLIDLVRLSLQENDKMN